MHVVASLSQWFLGDEWPLNRTSAASVAMFPRRVIARCGPPAGVPYNASALFLGKTVWWCGLLYAVYGTSLNWGPGLEQRLVRYRPILYVHVYILGYILKPFGGRMGSSWAGP